MVTGALIFARHFVDHTRSGLCFQSIGHQNVIDSQASVSAETKVAVVPPAVAFLGLFKQPEAVVQAMKFSGLIVRREPISDSELAELIQSLLFVDQARAQEFGTSGTVISSRKYSDDTLARVAGISTNVLCECPRHVAELISQLASFEEYSQECLNKNADDAHLHAYLRSISGSARSLFENALEKIAQHEGIDLSERKR